MGLGIDLGVRVRVGVRVGGRGRVLGLRCEGVGVLEVACTLLICSSVPFLKRG